MTTPADRRDGPTLRVVAECTDCEHVREKSYAAQGDSGFVVSCGHTDGKGRIGDTTWTTPAWCPRLADARAALGREMVGEASSATDPPLLFCADCGDPLAYPSTADECGIAHDGEEPTR